MSDKLKRELLMLEVEQDELAIVIGEAAMGVRRKAGQSATDALNEMNRHAAPGELGIGDGFRHAAMAAMLYFRAAIEKGLRPQ